jgi:hypothetical protein
MAMKNTGRRRIPRRIMHASSSAAAGHGQNPDYQPLPTMSIKQESLDARDRAEEKRKKNRGRPWRDGPGDG